MCFAFRECQDSIKRPQTNLPIAVWQKNSAFLLMSPSPSTASASFHAPYDLTPQTAPAGRSCIDIGKQLRKYIVEWTVV